MSKRNWSQRITRESNALVLDQGVFTLADPKKIARSLKRSARYRPNPFMSAMSMLNFYINRAGSNLSRERLRILSDAKVELRRLFRKLKK